MIYMKAKIVYYIINKNKQQCYYAKLYDSETGYRLFISYHIEKIKGISCWINVVIENNKYTRTASYVIKNRCKAYDNNTMLYAYSIADKYKDVPLTDLMYNKDFLCDILNEKDVELAFPCSNHFKSTKKAM